MPANMAAGVCRMNKSIPFTNRKLPSIYSESVPRSRSNLSAYSYPEKSNLELLVSKGHSQLATPTTPDIETIQVILIDQPF